MFPYMDSIEEAARRTAINLMRLNEAIDLADAERYSQAITPASGKSKRANRKNNLESIYKRWFNDVAGSTRKGSPDKGTIGSNSGGPAATREES